MRIIVNRRILNDLVTKAKRKASYLGCELAYLEKDFYKGLHNDIGVKKYSNSKGNISYKLNTHIKGSIGGLWNCAEKISNLVVDSTYKVYIPLNCFEDREGISTAEAIELKKVIEHKGLKLEGVLLNSGCIGNYEGDSKHIEYVCRDIKRRLDCRISLGGSVYITHDELPKEVDELRVGEIILNGEVSVVNRREENPFEVILDVLYNDKENKKLIIDAGYTDISPELRLPNHLKLEAINTEYSIISYKANVFEGIDKIYAKADYYTLNKIFIKWRERLEWN